MDNEKPAKTAILVIHGIGQQQPYETLDAFARGFSQALSKRDRLQWTIRHDLANLNGYTESRLHLSPPSQGETRGGESFDLYEVCWSPLTQRQIGYRQVLRFLQKAALSPLRYFATNLELLAEEQRAGKRPTGPAWVFVKEMFRIVILYLPVLFLLVAAGALFSDVPLLKNSFSSATDMLKSKLQIGWKGMGLIYLELVLWILLFMVTDSLFKLRKDRESMNRSAEKVWKRYLIRSSIGLTLLLSLKIWFYESFLGEALIAIPANLWIAVIALFLSFKAKRILVDFIGDITTVRLRFNVLI